jgi:cellulose synthase/poly-beta-1,6-N-acetylglucosamine synthase-like glycosyltransferase
MVLILALIFWFSLFFVFYTYFGYPILIGILAMLNQGPKWPTDHTPSVTMLIAAYNEEKVLRAKLENTLALDYPEGKLQVIVAADGSTDQTVEITNSFADQGVRLSFVPERSGKMAAITRAMKLAIGEIVVFSDANNMYEVSAIKKLVSPFYDSKIGAAVGAKLIVEDGRNLSSSEGFYWKYESWIKKSETTVGSCTTAVGEIFAIRRRQFVAPEVNIINDDRYMVFDLLRRGYRVVYIPDARSYEYVSKSAQDELTRRSRITAGAIQTIAMSTSLLPFNRPLILWQIISHKYFRTFVPYAMILVFLSNLTLVIIETQSELNLPLLLGKPLAQVFMILQLLFLGMAVVGNVIQVKGILGKVVYLPTFLVNSNIAQVVGMYKFLTQKQSHVWKRVQR